MSADQETGASSGASPRQVGSFISTLSGSISLPSPPVLPHRPHGSIHVLLSSLRTAGRYYLHVVRDGSDIRGSPFTITIDPGPPAELRLPPSY